MTQEIKHLGAAMLAGAIIITTPNSPSENPRNSDPRDKSYIDEDKKIRDAENEHKKKNRKETNVHNEHYDDANTLILNPRAELTEFAYEVVKAGTGRDSITTAYKRQISHHLTTEVVTDALTSGRLLEDKDETGALKRFLSRHYPEINKEIKDKNPLSDFKLVIDNKDPRKNILNVVVTEEKGGYNYIIIPQGLYELIKNYKNKPVALMQERLDSLGEKIGDPEVGPTGAQIRKAINDEVINRNIENGRLIEITGENTNPKEQLLPIAQGQWDFIKEVINRHLKKADRETLKYPLRIFIDMQDDDNVSRVNLIIPKNEPGKEPIKENWMLVSKGAYNRLINYIKKTETGRESELLAQAEAGSLLLYYNTDKKLTERFEIAEHKFKETHADALKATLNPQSVQENVGKILAAEKDLIKNARKIAKFDDGQKPVVFLINEPEARTARTEIGVFKTAEGSNKLYIAVNTAALNNYAERQSIDQLMQKAPALEGAGLIAGGTDQAKAFEGESAAAHPLELGKGAQNWDMKYYLANEVKPESDIMDAAKQGALKLYYTSDADTAKNFKDYAVEDKMKNVIRNVIKIAKCEHLAEPPTVMLQEDTSNHIPQIFSNVMLGLDGKTIKNYVALNRAALDLYANKVEMPGGVFVDVLDGVLKHEITGHEKAGDTEPKTVIALKNLELNGNKEIADAIKKHMEILADSAAAVQNPEEVLEALKLTWSAIAKATGRTPEEVDNWISANPDGAHPKFSDRIKRIEEQKGKQNTANAGNASQQKSLGFTKRLKSTGQTYTENVESRNNGAGFVSP